MTATEQSDVIEFITSPVAFGASPSAAVERIDTHGAVVALCGDRAFKLKRAVTFTFLDYGTVEKRKAACEAELAINRRTALELYLGVHTVTRDTTGACDRRRAYGLMRRFDQDGLFDRMAATGRLTDALTDGAADAVARLHETAARRDDRGGVEGMAWIIDGNLTDIESFEPEDFAGAGVERLSALTHAAFDAQKDLLEARRQSGLVRHCHGDLHLRNLCLIDGRQPCSMPLSSMMASPVATCSMISLSWSWT